MSDVLQYFQQLFRNGERKSPMTRMDGVGVFVFGRRYMGDYDDDDDDDDAVLCYDVAVKHMHTCTHTHTRTLVRLS